MHAELVVPGLLSSREPAPAARESVPVASLELLLARGRASRGAGVALEDWLARAFGTGAPLPAGALTIAGGGGDPGEAYWWRIDPVHLRQMRDVLALVPADAFGLTHDEAHALCAALNTHFGGDFHVQAVTPTTWCARRVADPSHPSRAAPAFAAVPPLAAAGTTSDPRRANGGATTRADVLLNEVQMLLHEHPVNAAREQAGQVPVNSVWLWGGGSFAQAPQGPWRSVHADEAIARGLARLAAMHTEALPARAADWLAGVGTEGRHLAVLDALRVPDALGDAEAYARALGGLERDWFAPLLEALRAGRVGMITVHVPDARDALSVETIRGDLRRLWRRRRALSAWA